MKRPAWQKSFKIYPFQNENPVWGHIQLRKPRSDATERGILSGSTMFA